MKGAVYESYIGPAILYESDAWCLKESEIGILRRTERFMVRAMCGLQLNDLQISCSRWVDQLAMANSVRWYGHVLRREDGHVLRRALYFEVGGQRKKGRLKRT